jgi:hypothetical protein
MRFTISSSPGARLLFASLGIGRDDAHLDVDDSIIRARLGWSGAVTIDRADVTSVERVGSIPWWLGIGIHGNLFGLLKVWAFNGSMTQGAVRLHLRRSARGRVLGVPIRATTIYLSLDDPDEFIAAVQPSPSL